MFYTPVEPHQVLLGIRLYDITSQQCLRVHLLKMEGQFVDFNDKMKDLKLGGPFQEQSQFFLC